MNPAVIGSTEIASHLGNYLAKVKDNGETFILTKDAYLVADLSPAPGSQGRARVSSWKFSRPVQAIRHMPMT